MALKEENGSLFWKPLKNSVMAKKKVKNKITYCGPKNSHRHKCVNCKRVWEHNDSLAGDLNAHTCTCGSIQWEEYNGSDPPVNFVTHLSKWD